MRLHVPLRQTTDSLLLKFVPQCTAVSWQDIQKLQDFLYNSSKLLVLTGAGVSTESGIPDYRSEKVGLYERTDRRPMQYQEFVKSSKGRQRYWARNFVGWPQFASFQPNVSHVTLADWEKKGFLLWLVTQNVDALHTKAGSMKVTELHGCSHRVVCLQCSNTSTRWELQKIFKSLNPDFSAESVEIAPDGDVLLSEEQVEGFQVPSCQSCGGVLIPDVVFFGDNVKRSIVDSVFQQVEACDKVLILGSSLHVFSSYRFARRAKELHKPIAAINIGPTRADSFINLKITARCGEVLPQLNI